MKIFLTGFKPFLSNEINPSELIVNALEGLCPSKTIEVAYDAVDEFFKSFNSSEYDAIVSIGLNASAETIRLEKHAYNEITKSHPDVRGVTPDRPIEAFGKEHLESSLPIDKLNELLKHSRIDACVSDNPGRYLCNYIYYLGLKVMKGNALFIHVPPISEKWPLEKMAEAIRSIVSYLMDIRL